MLPKLWTGCPGMNSGGGLGNDHGARGAPEHEIGRDGFRFALPILRDKLVPYRASAMGAFLNPEP